MIEDASPGAAAGASAVLLSTVGAGIAGVGIGLLAADYLAEAGAVILAVGLVAHLVGMVGRRRAQAAQFYRPAPWEQWAYWGCWAAIVGLATFVLFRATV